MSQQEAAEVERAGRLCAWESGGSAELNELLAPLSNVGALLVLCLALTLPVRDGRRQLVVRLHAVTQRLLSVL